MKKFIIAGTFCAVALLGGSQAAFAEETTTTTSTSRAEMMAKIQDLMKLIADLQAKLSEARGEVKNLVADLKVGATGDEVKEIQEILASDSTIFGVKPTGYFGPLTEEAIKKFQERYGLPVTGIVDEATREVMKELKMEKKNGMVPPGLVKSDEVKARIKARLQEKWGDCVWGLKFRASDCKKGHGSDDTQDDEADSDDPSADDSDDATNVEAKAAIKAAQDDIAEFRITIDDMDREDMKDALKTLRKAQMKLMEARKKLLKGEFDDAVEKAEEAASIVNGSDDDSDEDEDDSDGDSDDDGDKDEDEGDDD
jgi:peptidoglycan hydrolase-like protein with peptidoglycan-binding domain